MTSAYLSRREWLGELVICSWVTTIAAQSWGNKRSRRARSPDGPEGAGHSPHSPTDGTPGAGEVGEVSQRKLATHRTEIEKGDVLPH